MASPGATQRPLGFSARTLAADALRAAHIGILAFFAAGWALPWRWALWAVVIASIGTQLHWWLGNNQCYLTALEDGLRGPEVTHAPTTEQDADRPLNFIADLGTRALGRPMPHRLANALAYGFVWGGCAIAAARLALG